MPPTTQKLHHFDTAYRTTRARCRRRPRCPGRQMTSTEVRQPLARPLHTSRRHQPPSPLASSLKAPTSGTNECWWCDQPGTFPDREHLVFVGERLHGSTAARLKPSRAAAFTGGGARPARFGTLGHSLLCQLQKKKASPLLLGPRGEVQARSSSTGEMFGRKVVEYACLTRPDRSHAVALITNYSPICQC
jgi:hypothetical protein